MLLIYYFCYTIDGGKMDSKKLSVKTMVQFVYASGDLTNRSNVRKRQREGQLLHQYIQNQYDVSMQKEVFVETTFTYDEETYHLSGFIDGMRHKETLFFEEIKSTETDLSLIEETTYPAHMMQLKVYAYLYMLGSDSHAADIRLTYIHTRSKDVKHFDKRVQFDQLTRNFNTLLDAYMHWQRIYRAHQFEKERSIEGLKFPHETYREGQRPFMAATYQTLIKEDILYATAPTGIGKTVAALFAALKTIKNDKEKIFYLTAKNAGKHIAVDTVRELKAHGLKAKAITLNSKDNMCLMDEVDCDPDICPFAKGFYNRLSEALEDIFVHDDVYDMTLIKQYAEYHTICPHEFALSIANYADIIICDYNYAFDPRIQLIRFFEENDYQPKLLVDEAHNLVDRSRAMYSADLPMTMIETLKEETKKLPEINSTIVTLSNYMHKLISTHEVKKTGLHIAHSVDSTLLNGLMHVASKLESFLGTNKHHPKRKIIREHYFTLMHFIRVHEFFSDAFRFYIQEQQGAMHFGILCLDASTPLNTIIQEKVNGTVFFSATLKPVNYFSALFTKNTGRAFEIPSPFDPKRLGVYADISTSTKYHDRPASVTRIIDSIYAMLESKHGNYIVFFPSYAYMNMVLNQFDASDYDTHIQTRNMSLNERNDMLEAFKAKKEKPSVMFGVLGGSFSEGIDYVGDFLHGVMIVGVALPAFNHFNEMLKDYYYDQGYDGFHYAYTYPGMNKVIQAVGRVIRTDKDKGVAILIDERYQREIYKSLMPTHWNHLEWIEETDYVQGYLRQFWEKFKEE